VSLSKHERVLAGFFHAATMLKGACVVCNGHKAGAAHHVIPKRRLKTLPLIEIGRPGGGGEDRALVVWDSRNGLPVCIDCHEMLTNGTIKLTPGQLRPENVEFAYAYDIEHMLEREVPGYVPD
jgi:hypothetical protein